MEASDDPRLWDMLADWEEKVRRGEEVSAEELCRQCPELLGELKDHIHALRGMDWLFRPMEGHDDNSSADEAALPFDFGEYTVQEKIGAGGMGQVYKALHRRMGRTVALKLLPRAELLPPETLRRFQQEVRAAADLGQPYFVTAFDAGEMSGTPFLAMEYVEGPDLFRLVHERGPLPVGRAVAHIQQIARGLAHIHDKGIIHGDVKPSNLVLASDGTVKILDLGLARLRRIAHEETVMGTVDYLAPEQTAHPRQIDVRSDVYSLGCTLYFLLTGQPVYAGRTAIEKVLAHRQGALPSPRQLRPDVPRTVAAMFQKMIAKSPQERYQSMGEVLEASRQATLSKGARRGLWAGGAALLLVVGVALVLFGLGARPGKKTRRLESPEEIQATQEGIASLQGRKEMKALRLNYMPVTDSALAQLGDMPKLELLELVDTRITDDGLQHLQYFPALTWLDLSGTFVTDKGLRHLETLKSLKILRLNRLELTDTGLKNLTALANLELLELYDAPVTDAGMKTIGTLKKLNWLMLTGTEVGDAGLRELRGLPGIRRLYLERTKTTDAGIVQFRMAFPLCEIIR